jgi:hypothetical protein
VVREKTLIELRADGLHFSFPQVHGRAHFRLDFQRTLRIPDDGSDYPLPAGLGRFPLRHVDDFAERVPAAWTVRGGVLMPMYQSEALWLNFNDQDYPIAVKVAAGAINAVTGERWTPQLHHGVSPSKVGKKRVKKVQDYVVLPDQPWLDGVNVGQGRVRQFVAMPLGLGYTVEEQLTGRADVGGLQILAYPMKAEAYEEWRAARERAREARMVVCFAPPPPDAVLGMGLGAGGSIRQDISKSPHGKQVWDLDHPARCFVHLANSEQWATITGEAPPTRPLGPQDYARRRIPWFTYYAAGDVVPGSARLAELASVAHLAQAKGEPLPDNDPIPIDRVVDLTDRTAAKTHRYVDEWLDGQKPEETFGIPDFLL